MTERGTRARWTTAALVAPAAAALFTGTTVWAAGHQPATSTTASTKTAAPAPAVDTVDPQVAELQAAVDEARAQVADLRASVVDITKKANAVIKGAKVAPVKTSSSSSRSSSASSSRSSRSSSSSSSSSSKKKSSPPPSQGSTGASG